MMTKLKKWLIALIFGSAVLAAPFVHNEIEVSKIPNNLKLKCSKDKIIGSVVIDDNVKYVYISNSRVFDRKDEIVSRRTHNTRHFKTGIEDKISVEISVGAPYYKNKDSDWYYLNSAVTTSSAFKKQTGVDIFSKFSLFFISHIFATDIDKQIAASSDDGQASSGDTDYYSFSINDMYIGRGSYKNRVFGAWYRFTGISGLSGATINTAYISLYGCAAKEGTPLTAIYADDQVSPSYPTSVSDYDSRSLTSASINWDDEGLSTSAFTNSPSIISVIQELADSYDPTVIQILHRGDRSAAGDNNMGTHSYDEVPAQAPKLFISYSVGAERRVIKIE